MWCVRWCPQVWHACRGLSFRSQVFAAFVLTLPPPPPPPLLYLCRAIFLDTGLETTMATIGDVADNDCWAVFVRLTVILVPAQSSKTRRRRHRTGMDRLSRRNLREDIGELSLDKRVVLRAAWTEGAAL